MSMAGCLGRGRASVCPPGLVILTRFHGEGKLLGVVQGNRIHSPRSGFCA